MTVRYLAAVSRLLDSVCGRTGVIRVMVPTTQAEAVARAIESQIRARRLEWSAVAQLGAGPALLVGPPVSVDPEAVGRWMAGLNGLRTSLSLRGAQLFVLLEPAAMSLWYRHCPDAEAALAAEGEIAYEPQGRPLLADARRELGAAYRARFARFDLRGLIRSEIEDTAFETLDAYQTLRGRVVGPPMDALSGAAALLPAPGAEPEPVDRIIARLAAAPGAAGRVVLVGGPGSGKSFYLRRCALQGAVRAVFGRKRPLAVLVHAASLTSGRELPLLAQIVDHLLGIAPTAADFLATPGRARSLVLLIDGLDEVAFPGRLARWLGASLPELGRCVVVMATRPAGYDERSVTAGTVVTLERLSGSQIEDFLVRFCGRYARDRSGPEAEAGGRAEGRRLAHELRARPGLATLAGVPLLLTILAIVHRAGVRLPDHRVELFGHMTHVLVERWNRARSYSGVSESIGAPSLRTSDALRVLGPLALDLVASGFRAAIPESDVISALNRARRRGFLVPADSAADDLSIIRESLGLLVEQSPGAYGFLHLSLGEYLAGRELIRSGALDALLADAHRVLNPAWREPILLAIGELGLVRGEDASVEHLVLALCRTLEHATQDVLGAVSLLAALLLDDPMLSEGAARGAIGVFLALMGAPFAGFPTPSEPAVEAWFDGFAAISRALERLADPHARLHRAARHVVAERFSGDLGRIFTAAPAPALGWLTLFHDPTFAAWGRLGFDPDGYLVDEVRTRATSALIDGFCMTRSLAGAAARVYKPDHADIVLPARFFDALRSREPGLRVEATSTLAPLGETQAHALANTPTARRIYPIEAIELHARDDGSVELRVPRALDQRSSPGLLSIAFLVPSSANVASDPT